MVSALLWIEGAAGTLARLRPTIGWQGAFGAQREDIPTKYAPVFHFFDFLVTTDFVTSLHASFDHKVETMIKHVKSQVIIQVIIPPLSHNTKS